MGTIRRVVVLGAGVVGSEVARDLAGDFDVVAVDRSKAALGPLAAGGVATTAADVRDRAAVGRLVAPFDLVVGALPGALGFAPVAAAVEAGKPVVDVSFFPEDPFTLGEAAQRAGVPVLVDCGFAPGTTHAVLGRAMATIEVERYECLVGAIPAHPEPPWFYKAPFSPTDVLEEYTRPARLIEDGHLVTKPVLADREAVEIEGVGRLDAFLTDGLRTLLRLDVPNMVEKTLRWPGHLAKIEALRDAGLLDAAPVTVAGVAVRPRAVAEALLFPRWRRVPGEEELTVMRVTVEGTNGAGGRLRRVVRLLDRTDRSTGTTSMARTTAYPCAAAVRLLARGRFAPGVHGPERLGGSAEDYAFLLDEQRKRGVSIEEEATTT